MTEYTVNDSDFKLLGRTAAVDGSAVLSWTNSGFDFKYRGGGFVLFFEEYALQSPVYLKLIVDGKEQKAVVSTGREAVVYENIREGVHIARVIRITEGEVPLRVCRVRITGKKAQLLERPADKKIKLEFIGDSLTCGYGVLGEPSTTGFELYEEDGTRAYAYRAAELLGADASFVCVSGKGMVCDCTGARVYTVPEWYEYETRLGGKWDFSRFVPDVVVINIGTNDAWGQAPVEDFRRISFEFLSRLRGRYPNAYILWAFGFMGTALVPVVRDIVRNFNRTDGNTGFYNIPPVFGKRGAIGGGGHPSASANERLARSIARVISARFDGKL